MDRAAGVRFTAGGSHGDLTTLARDLQAVRDALRDIRREGQQAAASINAIKGGPGGLVDARGQPFRREEPAPEPSRTRQARQPAANADRNIFAGMQGGAGMSDAEWKELGRKQAQRREDALKAGMDLNRTERAEIGRTNAVVSSIRRRTGEDTQAMLGRVINAAGWSPFMPQSAYMLQMALGEMGLGLPLAGVAAGMGLAGLGAGALAANAFATNQARTGQQTYAATGSPFVANAYAGGAAVAQLATERAGQLHLTGEQIQGAVSGLAAGGLSGPTAFGQALDQAAVLINAFGMSVSDATAVIATMQTDTGKTGDQVTQALQSLAKVADATNQPLAALGQIVEQTPNLIANLVNPGDYGVVAAVARAIGGTTQGGIAVQSIANASGAQALGIAAQMGLTDQQFNALQGNAAGQTQIDQFVIRTVKDQMTAAGGAVDQALIATNAMLGANFTKAQIERINNLPFTTTDQAYQAALAAGTPPLIPGAAGNVGALIAQGNLQGAAAAAVPWNVKDMAVNATQVWLTGGTGFLGRGFSQIGAGFAHPNQPLPGPYANVSGQIMGGAPLYGSQYDLKGVAPVSPPVTVTGLPNQPLTGSQYHLGTPGGGGGGGVVEHRVTIDLRQDGRQVASIPVAIQPGGNQQYSQYVPVRYHAPGRGMQ